ncbi:hypothetical protein [Streptomyces sp. NBC_00183]|uniref:hypothetical protein n=1 Tax=unclassified Streptomyces TaxID=2593676 RepID=UPI002254B8C7|nr:hypothetical protein [Streptomyces sp. NBC_00183]MCX5287198.1 hypothetical protein [Streptomyces sp. NBC_00183]
MPGRTGGSTDDGVGQRLRRFQERLDPIVTRVLLAGIFITGLAAQFIKPVGDALEGKAFLGGALLSLVGYVLYDTVRELSSSVRVPSRALVNSSQLGSFVSGSSTSTICGSLPPSRPGGRERSTEQNGPLSRRRHTPVRAGATAITSDV